MVYPDKVRDLVRDALHGGAAHDAACSGADANLACGCVVRLGLRIDEPGRISELRFSTNGCGFMTAAAETIARRLEGKFLSELGGLGDDVFDAVRRELEIGEHSDRRACVDAVESAAKNAFNNYRSSRIVEFAGEKGLVCTCFGISEETIERYVEERSPGSADDVAAAIRAGSGCGSCRMLIQEIIDSHAA